MRLFAAIMITGQYHEALAGTLEVMKQSGISGRFVPAKNLHITLTFIGTQESAEPVVNALLTVNTWIQRYRRSCLMQASHMIQKTLFRISHWSAE